MYYTNVVMVRKCFVYNTCSCQLWTLCSIIMFRYVQTPQDQVINY